MPEGSIYFGDGYTSDNKSTFYRMAMIGEGIVDTTDDSAVAGLAWLGYLDLAPLSQINVGANMAIGGWWLYEQLVGSNIEIELSQTYSIYLELSPDTDIYEDV